MGREIISAVKSLLLRTVRLFSTTVLYASLSTNQYLSSNTLIEDRYKLYKLITFLILTTQIFFFLSQFYFIVLPQINVNIINGPRQVSINFNVDITNPP